LEVDIRAGARVNDRDAQRDIIAVQAESARHAARLQADRGAHPQAVALLQAVLDRIGKLDGFVKNDGTPIAELYEQIVDEIAIHDASLSRQHTRIQFVNDHYVIQDLGSTNGTQVNGQHVTSAVLADGDEIHFGNVMMRFVLT